MLKKLIFCLNTVVKIVIPLTLKKVRWQMKPITIAFASISVLLSSALVSAFESIKQPVLYPNAHYETMGSEAAREDIAACWELARKTGAHENNEAQVSQDAADDAAALAVFAAATASSRSCQSFAPRAVKKRKGVWVARRLP